MVVTLGLTVFVDLVTAVVMGLLVAGMVAARQIERLELDSVISVPLLDQSFLVGQKDAAEVDPFSARVGPGGAQGDSCRCVLQQNGRCDQRRHSGP